MTPTLRYPHEPLPLIFPLPLRTTSLSATTSPSEPSQPKSFTLLANQPVVPYLLALIAWCLLWLALVRYVDSVTSSPPHESSTPSSWRRILPTRGKLWRSGSRR